MAELLLVNPRRRKRRKPAARRKRRSAPRAVHRRRRRRAVVRLANPRRRRRHSVARISRRRRRNPSLRGFASSFMPTAKAGFMGALGGLGLDVLMGQATKYLPASLASGWGKTGVKLAGSLLVGMIGSKILKGRGRDLSVGAFTIVLHDVLKEQLASAVPSLPLGEYMTYAPVVGYDNGTAPALSTGMGEYLPSGQYDYSDMNYGAEF